MKRNVLIIGHADGDGHLIAEQTRRNLASVPSFDVTVLVDPKRTQGHQIWTRLDQLSEINQADIVFFVDLMFSPMAYVEQAQGLVDFVRFRPAKSFYLIDHHPVPGARLSDARNLRTVYRPDVFECTFGPRSGMMVVAALCERQNGAVATVVQPVHELLATGMRRAAAPGGALSGSLLMNLLKNDRWDALLALANDDVLNHRLVRGRRVANSPQSDVMMAAIAIAEGRSKDAVNQAAREGGSEELGRITMPYDIGLERFSRESEQPHNLQNAPIPAKDLEALMTLLEVAAISLTTSPEATFALEELVDEARILGGEGIVIDIRDVENVLGKVSFLEKFAGRMRLR